MAVTTWVLCDSSGQPVTEIVNAAETVFSARRNQGRQATVALAHDDQEAVSLVELLANGTPQLRYYRDMTLRLSAYLTAIERGLSEDGEDRLTATFKDPFGRMLGDGSEVGRHLSSALTFTAQDQGQIGWDLIDALNAVGDTGISQGAIETTTPRDRTYEAGKNVGQALVELTEVLGGFDFEILPLDPASSAGKLGEYVVYAAMGEDRPELIWGFGKGTMANVRDVTQSVAPPINRVRMVTADGLVSVKTDTTSIGRYGEWSASVSAPTDVTVQATLDDQANDRLRPNWVEVTAFTPEPAIGPQPFDDFWLGDTGRFRVVQGAFDDSFVPQIEGITITEDADDNEVFDLEVVEA